jgi:hypothetical protein
MFQILSLHLPGKMRKYMIKLRLARFERRFASCILRMWVVIAVLICLLLPHTYVTEIFPGCPQPILPSSKQKGCIAHLPHLSHIFDCFCLYFGALRYKTSPFMCCVYAFPSPPVPFLSYIFSDSCYLITENYETDEAAISVKLVDPLTPLCLRLAVSRLIGYWLGNPALPRKRCVWAITGENGEQSPRSEYEIK